MAIVEEYWSGIARRLQVESGVFNRLIPHNLERGVQNELSLSRVIDNFLPPNIGVGSGLVFDINENMSRQCDIVLYDKSIQPQLLAQTTQVLFPVETVRMIIEVKSRLSKADILDSAKKKSDLDRLEPQGNFRKPPFGLFAYQFADSVFGRAEDLEGLDKSASPDLVCIVDPGYVKHPTHSGSGGFVPLHNLDLEGNRISKSWRVPSDDETSQSIILDGIQYPIITLGRYKGERLVGEPGRAMLVFGAAILDLLDPEQAHSWISGYVSDELTEVVSLGEAEPKSEIVQHAPEAATIDP